ncbi:hypothetical protein F3P66_24560 (plasmid) [Agrobacterium fabrum]|uniref:Uncharacterized protein n=1 Tax=Agrobacterium fabrum (strain C58 / ATCC 33970) TaxID=176299 RepID=A9CL65_AGRFC|nr:hypothetical protein Atu5451 [Agrobacterium fabrum str. C58]KJX90095.1 hypothetical protein SY94_5498 [Agrobacterium tumefaciens]QRM62571.1 hypothetical protein F3P66_24560 [Agrobacterium fabrum]TRB22711.1 hypothetical protein EXN51_26010 [Agrobacterium fabrum]
MFLWRETFTRPVGAVSSCARRRSQTLLPRRDIDYDAPLSRPPPVGLLPPPPSFVSTIIDLSGPENYIA